MSPPQRRTVGHEQERALSASSNLPSSFSAQTLKLEALACILDSVAFDLHAVACNLGQQSDRDCGQAAARQYAQRAWAAGYRQANEVICGSITPAVESSANR